MGYVIRMPQLGMSMDQGTVVEWRVGEGDAVEEDETVAVVESEKASADVDAREDGTLLRVIVPESGTVEPGEPIGIVGAEGEDLSAYDVDVPDAGEESDSTSEAPDADETGESSGTDTPASAPSTDSDVRATPGAKQAADETSVDLTAVEGTGPGGVVTEDDVREAASASGGDAGSAGSESAPSASDVRATPGAKQAAREAGIDLATVEGSGPGGVVTEDDVEDATASAQSPAEDADASADEPTQLRTRERRELSGVQQSISDRLQQSNREAVHVTLNRQFDTRTLDTYVEAAKTVGVDVSYTDLLIKAVGEALVEHPAMNAHFVDGEHVLYEDVNVGVAVDSEGRLVTPVVAGVTDRGVREVGEERRRLTSRVLDGEFTMDDLEGGTFTISNLGMFGVDHFDPVINPPEIGILGVGRRREDATMVLSLSFDHRVVNGAGAARFLDTVVDRLTDESALREYFE